MAELAYQEVYAVSTIEARKQSTQGCWRKYPSNLTIGPAWSKCYWNSPETGS